jgi:DnaJ domain
MCFDLRALRTMQLAAKYSIQMSVVVRAKISWIGDYLLAINGPSISSYAHQNYQRTGFHSSRYDQQRGKRSFSATLRENPYCVLNIPPNSSYETVKSAFLKAALIHHPDHSKTVDSVATFVRIRQAFEEIVSYKSNGSNDDGTSWYDDKKPPVWRNDDEFQKWFHDATGEHLSFDMNHQTRQEVIRVYRTMSSGGKDKGGYWEMARQLAEREDAFFRAGGRSSSNGQAIGNQSTPQTNPIRRKRNR